MVKRFQSTGSVLLYSAVFCVLTCCSSEEKYPVIDMIVAHHKSIYKDVGGKGLLDLDENEPEVFEKHIKGFDVWSKDALSILENLKIGRCLLYGIHMLRALE